MWPGYETRVPVRIRSRTGMYWQAHTHAPQRNVPAHGRVEGMGSALRRGRGCGEGAGAAGAAGGARAAGARGRGCSGRGGWRGSSEGADAVVRGPADEAPTCSLQLVACSLQLAACSL